MIKRLKAYYYLTKPNVMYLSVISSLTTYMHGMSVGEVVDSFEKAYTMMYFMLGMILGSGSAGVFNMCLEVDRDRLMTRTCKRPIVNGDVSLVEGYVLGVVLLTTSVLYLWQISIISTALLLFTVFFYAIVYTLFLKPYTDMNIVIGGIAGALPVLIGWYASHDYFSIMPYFLFFLIIFWTPAHFWALAIFKINDYKMVGLPMRPLTVGIQQTAREIFVYSILTVICAYGYIISPFIEFNLSWSFEMKPNLIILTMFNIMFLYRAYDLSVDDENAEAGRQNGEVAENKEVREDSKGIDNKGVDQVLERAKKFKDFFLLSVKYLFGILIYFFIYC